MSKRTERGSERPPSASDDVPVVRTRMPLFSGPEHTTPETASSSHAVVVIDALAATLQFETEAECAAHMARLAQLPRRTLPPIIVGLPAWLAELEPADDVRVFDGRHDRLEVAGQLRLRLLEQLRRQAAGSFTAEEVAGALADLHHAPVDLKRREIDRAFAAKSLRFYESSAASEPIDVESARATLEGTYGEHWAMHATSYAMTRPEDVDRWLATVDEGNRFARFPRGPWSVLPSEQSNERADLSTGAGTGAAGVSHSPTVGPRSSGATAGGLRRTHRTAKRGDAVLAAIDAAVDRLRGQGAMFDTDARGSGALVWAELQKMAAETPPFGAFIGPSPGGGINWTTADDAVSTLTKDLFNDRWSRWRGRNGPRATAQSRAKPR